MSWAELSSEAAPVLRESPLESERFGLSIQRATVPSGASATIDGLLSQVTASTSDVVILRYPQERVDWFAALSRLGRHALFADSLVYWRLRTGSSRRRSPADQVTTAVKPVEPATIDELMADIFAGYGNHYLANPLFDRALATAGYQDWARRSALGTPPVTVAVSGTLAGIATVTTAADHLEIELAGVRPSHQAQGLYGHLLAATEDLAAAGGRSEVVISTQGHNTNVQRAWARFGFEPIASFVTVHLVDAGLLPDRLS